MPRMACKDIPDAVFLAAVRETPPVDDPAAWRTRWAVAVTLAAKLGISEIPERLLLAKADKLIRRKLLGGCACGCRGDFHILAPVVMSSGGFAYADYK